MSLGEMMKCNFVASTLHMPKVVFLDEPTIGVDIMSKAALKKAMLEMRAKYGTTFILTTHIVEDISIADRVLMLHNGRLVFDGTKEKLEHMFGDKRVVEIKFLPDAKLNLDFGKVLYRGADVARLEINANVLKSRRFINLLSNKSIIDYSVSAPSLNELLTKMYTKLEKVH
jgi:ABC-2 type transport system ATP-binding protein